MGVELGSIGTGIVGEDFVFDTGPGSRAFNFPAALVQFSQGNGFAAGVLRTNPVYVLREVAHLIERVPNRELQFMSIESGWKVHGDADQDAIGIFQRNCVLDGILRSMR